MFPPFAKRTVTTLKPMMQDGILPSNPLDSGIPTGMENAAKMCEAVLTDPNVDMVAWASQLPGRKAKWDDVTPIRRLLDITDKPFVGFGRMYYQVTQEGLDAQESIGIPFLQGLEPTLRALNALAFYSGRAGRKIKPIPGPRIRSDTPDAGKNAHCLWDYAAQVGGRKKRDGRGPGRSTDWLSGRPQNYFRRHCA